MHFIVYLIVGLAGLRGHYEFMRQYFIVVEIRLNIKIQLPKYTGSGLKIIGLFLWFCGKNDNTAEEGTCHVF